MSYPTIITAKNKPNIVIYVYRGLKKKDVQKIVKIACNDKHMARNPNWDEAYGMARLICACEEYLNEPETGFGVYSINNIIRYYDHYTIDENWKVHKVKR